MSKIQPFRALRYTRLAGDIADCVCPPYDIISESERKALIEKNEYNLVRLELPAGENRYAEAGKTLRRWIDEGILARDEKAGIFIYRELFNVGDKDYTLTGIVGAVRLYDFSERVVLPHEETLSKAKADRFELMCATGCNFSSVYSLYSDESGVIASVIAKNTQEEPIYDFTDEENVTHRLWKIEDEDDIEVIQTALADKQLFIADGHHRYETALNYRNRLISSGDDIGSADYIMMTLVDMDDKGLVVFPTHRIVFGREVDREELVTNCGEYFDTSIRPLESLKSDLADGVDGHTFAMYTGGEDYLLLKARAGVEKLASEGRSRAYGELDVSILHKLILENALGIDRENMALQKNLRYTRSAEEAIDSVKSGQASVAFIINATKVSQIKAVALAGDKMPQKSTYFYPKLKTGLVMRETKKGL